MRKRNEGQTFVWVAIYAALMAQLFLPTVGPWTESLIRLTSHVTGQPIGLSVAIFYAAYSVFTGVIAFLITLWLVRSGRVERAAGT